MTRPFFAMGKSLCVKNGGNLRVGAGSCPALAPRPFLPAASLFLKYPSPTPLRHARSSRIQKPVEVGHIAIHLKSPIARRYVHGQPPREACRSATFIECLNPPITYAIQRFCPFSQVADLITFLLQRSSTAVVLLWKAPKTYQAHPLRW